MNQVRNRQGIDIPKDEVAAFCKRHRIRKLSLFGSALRDDFRPGSDVDVLVEFQPGHGPGFLKLFEMEEELSRLFGGHKIDMVTEKFLNRRIRDDVLAQAEIQYAEG